MKRLLARAKGRRRNRIEKPTMPFTVKLATKEHNGSESYPPVSALRVLLDNVDFVGSRDKDFGNYAVQSEIFAVSQIS